MGEDGSFVMLNGMKVAAGWPEQLKAAQEITHYRIGGNDHRRIAYGGEPEDWGADQQPCHDCAAVKGQFHVVGCDVERCPMCGGQVISCDCPFDSPPEDGEFDPQKHKDKAIADYLMVRPHYEKLCVVVKSIIEEAIAGRGTKIHSVQARAKDPISFAEKAAKPSEESPSDPMYPNPLEQITDLAGVRIITFVPKAIGEIDSIISDEFNVLERSDKG